MEWSDGAPCHGNGDLFYPEDYGNETLQNAKIAAAKAICDACPVLRDCGRWAILRPEPFGIWGGMTVRERGRVRRRMGKSANPIGRSLQPCGTQAAIRRHHRKKEPLCRACHDASAVAWADKKAAAA
nr:WhiB family transcriptional regulator [Actinacidiphila rubida]